MSKTDRYESTQDCTGQTLQESSAVASASSEQLDIAARLHKQPAEISQAIIHEAITFTGCDACSNRTYVDLDQAISLSMVSDTCMGDVHAVLDRIMHRGQKIGRVVHSTVSPRTTCPLYEKHRNELWHDLMTLDIMIILSPRSWLRHRLPFDERAAILAAARSCVKQQDLKGTTALAKVANELAEYHSQSVTASIERERSREELEQAEKRMQRAEARAETLREVVDVQQDTIEQLDRTIALLGQTGGPRD